MSNSLVDLRCLKINYFKPTGKAFIYLVGTGGLEPPTPTVSKKNIKINEMGFLPSLIDLLTL